MPENYKTFTITFFLLTQRENTVFQFVLNTNIYVGPNKLFLGSEFWVIFSLGAVRMGCVDHELIVNPTRRQLNNSTLDLIVAAADKKKVGQFITIHYKYGSNAHILKIMQCVDFYMCTI